MAALVPYAGRGAIRYATPLVYTRTKRARTQAYALAGSALRAGAKYTWRNRKGIARKIRRVYRKSVRSRLEKGSKSNSKAKQDGMPATLTDVNMGALVLDKIRFPDMSSSNFYNARTSANIYVKGIKLCRYFENTETNRIYEVHHALVQFKRGSITPPGSTSILNEFWRDYSSSSDRVHAFTEYPISGSALWDFRMNCCAMNPNKELTILWHKKRWLMPKEPNTTGNARHLWKIHKYVPIKKNFTFPYQSSNSSNCDIYEIYWYNTVTPTDFPATNPGAVVDVKTMHSNTTYFGEKANK